MHGILAAVDSQASAPHITGAGGEVSQGMLCTVYSCIMSDNMPYRMVSKGHGHEWVHLLLVWSHISVEEGIWILCELSS